MKAYSVKNVLDAKFNCLEFDGEWEEAVGRPEVSGTWAIAGYMKSGKTTFAMMLAKYLTRFGKVYYNPIEEGFSRSIQMAYERVNMIEVSGKIIMKKESVEEMIERLSKHKSPRFVFVDSIQFAELTKREYKKIKETFSNKVIVYISHMAGNNPDGKTAQFICRDANVLFNVEGYRAFPTSRYGGGQSIDIHNAMAEEYWLTKNSK